MHRPSRSPLSAIVAMAIAGAAGIAPDLAEASQQPVFTSRSRGGSTMRHMHPGSQRNRISIPVELSGSYTTIFAFRTQLAHAKRNRRHYYVKAGVLRRNRFGNC